MCVNCKDTLFFTYTLYYKEEADPSGPAFRATNGARTRDLRLGKPPLYQLSYCRKIRFKNDILLFLLYNK